MIWFSCLIFGCTDVDELATEKTWVSEQKGHTKELEEKKEKVGTSSEVIPHIVKAPDFPKNGMLLSPQIKLSQQECTQKFPSCSVVQDTSYFAPTFQSEILDLSVERQQQMLGKTFREGCPVGFDALALVRFLHWNEQLGVQWGEVVVAHEEAKNMEEIFRSLYEIQFPITSAKPMFHFDGNDDLSMEANNTSVFNCRKVKNSKRYSEHSYGKAIDINPLWNPWVSKSGRVDPPSGKPFVDRNLEIKGLIKAQDEVVRLFESKGWKWGGYWRNSKDYQHFSVSGR